MSAHLPESGWIDLTMTIAPNMPQGPDHAAPEFRRYAKLDTDGWEGTLLTLSSHIGTHIDAPSHFVDSAPTIDQVSLRQLAGTAQIIHLHDLRERQPIGVNDLGAITAPRVMVCTGWAEHATDVTRYFERHPYLTDEAGMYLVDNGIVLLGIDTPSVDYDPPSAVHKAVLGSGAVIVENLTNLRRLGTRCELVALPLPLAGVDGSPARIIARPL